MANTGITITDSEKFETIINNYDHIVAKIIVSMDKQNNNFKKVQGTNIWTGDLQDSVSVKYKQLSNNYENIAKSLISFSDFMKNTLNLYKNAESSLQSDIENNHNDLDVNN